MVSEFVFSSVSMVLNPLVRNTIRNGNLMLIFKPKKELYPSMDKNIFYIICHTGTHYHFDYQIPLKEKP